MTLGEKTLQNLVDQIPELKGAKARWSERSKCYFVDIGNVTPFGFQSQRIGINWLTRWINTGKRPPLSELRFR